ncbi:MAG: hypothetical protein AAB550_04105 [Patescibacteria group bacterium]
MMVASEAVIALVLGLTSEVRNQLIENGETIKIIPPSENGEEWLITKQSSSREQSPLQTYKAQYEFTALMIGTSRIRPDDGGEVIVPLIEYWETFTSTIQNANSGFNPTFLAQSLPRSINLT